MDAPAPDSAGGDDRTTEFVRLLNRCERQLTAYVMSQVLNWADVDEIVQETRIQLWRQFDAYRPDKDFCVWACTIAHYRVLAHRTLQGRHAAIFSDAYAAIMAEQFASTSHEPRPLQHALHECLEGLTDRSRDILGEYYSQAATVEELARRYGRSASAVYKILAAARTFLYRCIDRALRGEPS